MIKVGAAMEKRSSSLDLLRCVAFLLVVVFHSFLNNAYYAWPQTGIAMWIAGSFRWLSVSCIGLFLMLTGYLKSGKTDIKSCYRALGPIILGYLVASAISIPVRHFMMDDVQTLREWFKRLINFNASYYGWYVEMYIGLVLLIPFVNLALERIQSTRTLLIFGAVLLCLTAIPGATPKEIAPDYWRKCYPITYYVLGAIVRRTQPKLSVWIGIGAALAMAFLMGTVTILSTDGTIKAAWGWEFQDLWTVFMVVCIFLALYRVKVPSCLGRILAFGASGCYGGYLLSHLLDSQCYLLIPQWKHPRYYALSFLFITIPIYIVSILMGVLLERLVKWPFSRRKKVHHVCPGQ